MPEKNLDFYIEANKELIEKSDSPWLAHVHNFGCQLNFSDGEKIKGLLLQMGFGLTERIDDAKIVIFNTCAVRETAEEKVFGNIGVLKKIKEDKKDLIIGICGCMTEQDHVVKRIKKSYPCVDLIFGTTGISKFPKLLNDVLKGHKKVYEVGIEEKVEEDLYQERDSTFKASVPIMYGCNNFCTYCIVPYVRGRERSRPLEKIINEIKDLALKGYKEIMLLGQNVNSYGNDLENSIGFSGLLKEIDKIQGNFIIRFMSSHPKDVNEELIDTIINSDKIAKHLHFPVQSGSNNILKEMNRKYTVEQYVKIVDYAREKKPDFAFSTDIIVGFPNETEEDFEATLNLIKKVKYDNIYTFIYSKRSGTKAALIEDKTPYEEKQKRINKLLKIQREISTENNSRFIGKILTVLVDGPSKKNDNYYVGKNNEFIIVEFKSDNDLTGKFVEVKINEARNWAVLGELI